METWRDAKWWLALGTTVILGVGSLIYSFATRTAKALSIEVVSVASIVDVSQRSDIAIVVHGSRASRVFSQVVSIRNTGTLPIVPSDFVRPLSLDYGRDGVLTCRVSQTSPRDLSPQAVLDAATGQVVLGPLLLNPNDSVTVEILTADESLPEAHARIAGVKDLSVSRLPVALPLRYHRGDGYVGALALTAGFAIYSVWFWPVAYRNRQMFRPIELIIAAVINWASGLALMDYGARHNDWYAVLPSNVTRLLLALAYGVIVGFLFWKTRPAMSAG